MMLTSALLENSQGMQVTLINYGARIASIQCMANGKMTEMTVTPVDIEALLKDELYLGATCGPVCNRISQARFQLDGHTYQLQSNDGENCLHGGKNNVSFRFWQLLQLSDNEVSLQLELKHLEDGFPGNRKLAVHYRLTEDNALHIDYSVETDRDTPVNITNHSYFSLGEEDILNLSFKLNSERFLERSGNGIPTGGYVDSSATGFDMTQWQSVGEFIDRNQYEQIVTEEGVDHCFVMADTSIKAANAELVSQKNKIRLSVFSDQVATQFYTGKFLAHPFKPYQGLCFESQAYTDAVNRPEFPSVVLSSGERYQHQLIYQFSYL
ncbi:MAG: aldose epimerase family protein [Pseudomonadales bacterium]